MPKLCRYIWKHVSSCSAVHVSASHWETFKPLRRMKCQVHTAVGSRVGLSERATGVFTPSNYLQRRWLHVIVHFFIPCFSSHNFFHLRGTHFIHTSTIFLFYVFKWRLCFFFFTTRKTLVSVILIVFVSCWLVVFIGYTILTCSMLQGVEVWFGCDKMRDRKKNYGLVPFSCLPVSRLFVFVLTGNQTVRKSLSKMYYSIVGQ